MKRYMLGLQEMRVEFGMDVMIRTLQGQGPRIQSILVGPATKNFNEISNLK